MKWDWVKPCSASHSYGNTITLLHLPVTCLIQPNILFNRTLLQQGPFNGRPTIQRVLIVTPSSLVKNWEKEFRRWLGRERINVFTADQVYPIAFFAIVRLHQRFSIAAKSANRILETATLPSHGGLVRNGSPLL